MNPNNQVICQGRFLIDIRPEQHPLAEAFGNTIVRWDLVDLDEGQDATGLAVGWDVGWTEAVTEARRIRNGAP